MKIKRIRPHNNPLYTITIFIMPSIAYLTEKLSGTVIQYEWIWWIAIPLFFIIWLVLNFKIISHEKIGNHSVISPIQKQEHAPSFILSIENKTNEQKNVTLFDSLNSIQYCDAQSGNYEKDGVVIKSLFINIPYVMILESLKKKKLPIPFISGGIYFAKISGREKLENFKITVTSYMADGGEYVKEIPIKVGNETLRKIGVNDFSENIGYTLTQMSIDERFKINMWVGSLTNIKVIIYPGVVIKAAPFASTTIRSK